MDINQKMTCQVTGIQPYGVFVTCGEKKGLIHISEVSDMYITDLHEIVHLGDMVTCIVIGSDKDNLKLSLKRAYPIPEHIYKHSKIKIGFLTLERSLPHFILKAKKERTPHD
jgi:general stress protein 13